MERIIAVLLVAIMMSGCSLFKTKPQVTKTILVCPPPAEFNNGKPVERYPDLEIFKLKPGATEGEIARAYTISVKQLQGHAEMLYNILDSYAATSEHYKELKKALDLMYPDGFPVEGN